MVCLLNCGVYHSTIAVNFVEQLLKEGHPFLELMCIWYGALGPLAIGTQSHQNSQILMSMYYKQYNVGLSNMDPASGATTPDN